MATVSKPSVSELSFVGDDVEKLVEAAIEAYTTGSASFTSDVPPPFSFPISGKTVTIQAAAPSFTVTVS